jgi:hypothetical protein
MKLPTKGDLIMNCEHCKKQASRVIDIFIHDHLGDVDARINFCSWECAAQWFNREAGEILMPDLDCEYWRTFFSHPERWPA